MATIVIPVRSESRPDVTHQVRLGRDLNWYCTCEAWRFQRKAPAKRTCKHLRQIARAMVKTEA